MISISELISSLGFMIKVEGPAALAGVSRSVYVRPRMTTLLEA